MNKRNNKKKTEISEKRLESLKKDFIKIIPQIQDIQEVQEKYREIQEKKTRDQYPFINTQASTTI
jgi:nitrogenase subunit NifH